MSKKFKDITIGQEIFILDKRARVTTELLHGNLYKSDCLKREFIKRIELEGSEVIVNRNERWKLLKFPVLLDDDKFEFEAVTKRTCSISAF